MNYAPPLDGLVTLGEADFGHRAWLDYPARFGLGPEHVPELLRMLRDPRWEEAAAGSPFVYAGIHAWRALGQLRAEAAIPELLRITREADRDDDWVGEDLPVAFGHIGAPAYAPLAALFSDRRQPGHVRSRAASSLAQIAGAAPELRSDAVRLLTRALDAYTPESPDMHAYIVIALLHLRAVESLASVRRAYEEARVDDVFVKWRDVQTEFGLAGGDAAGVEQLRRSRHERRERERALQKMAKKLRKRDRR